MIDGRSSVRKFSVVNKVKIQGRENVRAGEAQADHRHRRTTDHRHRYRHRQGGLTTDHRHRLTMNTGKPLAGNVISPPISVKKKQ